MVPDLDLVRQRFRSNGSRAVQFLRRSHSTILACWSLESDQNRHVGARLEWERDGDPKQMCEPAASLKSECQETLRLYNYHHRQRRPLLIFPAEDSVAGEATAGAGFEPNFLIHRSTKGFPTSLPASLYCCTTRRSTRSLCAV